MLAYDMGPELAKNEMGTSAASTQLPSGKVGSSTSMPPIQQLGIGEIPMKKNTITILAVLFLYSAAWGQTGTAIVSEALIDVGVENYVNYRYNTIDTATFATDPSRTTQSSAKNFAFFTGIADVVSVNGKAAKGVLVERRFIVTLRPNPASGQGIGDLSRDGMVERHLEILTPDGAPVGTITALGLLGGTAPPGSPLSLAGGNITIVGGTGAFLGVRGQTGGRTVVAGASGGIAPRNASVTEDPANRRVHGGGSATLTLRLMPVAWPGIVVTATGPAVAHSSDFAPVNAAKPARPGEILSLIATNLGPTRPGVDPGQPFPASPLQPANSPIDVTVNGVPAEVLYAGGYPEAVNLYQVNFRVPDETSVGMARIQLSAAWIAGPEVRIAVQ